jgi:glycogen operon protein
MAGPKRLQTDSRLLPDAGFRLSRGVPLPLGATYTGPGINFAIFSRSAVAVTLVIFPPWHGAPRLEFPLVAPPHRTGDIWHAFLEGVEPGTAYAYRLEHTDGAEVAAVAGTRQHLLLDPYARALCGAEQWGHSPARSIQARRGLVVQNDFAWGADLPLRYPLADSIIYELHVRGFTRHPSARVQHPGTFLGIVEKIPYLQELGVTAVELLPVCEFEENDNPRCHPLTGEPLKNFWGYHPISLFAPKASYAANTTPGGQVQEFQTMVKALHAAGIEVILDVVLNHTGEGDEHCLTWSYRGLDKATYYLLEPTTGQYENYTGCGNTLHCQHPVVQDLLLDVLRYWVTEMHVDGFRFDLAAIFNRGRNGAVFSCSPLLERLTADPVLAHTKLIAEPWDAAGLHQGGTFSAQGGWAEWNDRFRDDLRQFVKGDAGMVPRLAECLTGSPHIFAHQGGTPYCSVNFVTCHDGFTLADLVSYNHKHNDHNGEGGRDGTSANHSWNCGTEGPTACPEVLRLRQRQMKNMVTLLLMAQGVPMILSGDEMGRTQYGNNNAYCHDSALTWLDWRGREAHAELWRFVALLIRFRKAHPVLRQPRFLPNDPTQHPAVVWHGCHLGQPDWSWESRTLAMHLIGGPIDVDIYAIANAHWEAHDFALPVPSLSKCWYRFVDTMRAAPHDICPVGEERFLTPATHYHVEPRSVVVLVGK